MLYLFCEGCMKSMQEKCCIFVFLGDLEAAIFRIPKKVLELAMRRKGIPYVLVGSVMSLYDGARTRV